MKKPARRTIAFSHEDLAMSAYLAVDLGTTGCRSIVFDESLNVLGASYEEYGLFSLENGWVEQDARLWWEMTLRTAKRAIADCGISPQKIKGISISSQGITIVPVDDKLEPLSNAISWLDTRAKEETKLLIKEEGRDNLYLRTGKHIDALYSLPKILWLRNQRRSVFERAYKILMPMEFLIGKLTGHCVTDHSMASGTLLYDIHSGVWSDALLTKYDIPREMLPSIRWSGEVVGAVLPGVAAELGLSEDCIVTVGAQDQKCAAFGVGLKEGVITTSLGTACAVSKLWHTPELERFVKVGWCGYVQKNTWVTEGVINTAGASIRWLRDLMFRGESYALLDQEAEKAIQDGSTMMFYPYLSDTNTEGVFTGLKLGSNRGAFAAAVLEGVAFQIRSLLQKMDAYPCSNSLVLFGGGAKSTLWCQIIADITGLNVKVPRTEEAAGAGAAKLAAMGCGERLPPLEYKSTYFPSKRQQDYEAKYRLYCDTELRLLTGESYDIDRKRECCIGERNPV